MSSHSDRFTTPHTYIANDTRTPFPTSLGDLTLVTRGRYIANDTRQGIPLRPPYVNDLGPGSYDVASSTLVVTRPDEPQVRGSGLCPRPPRSEPRSLPRSLHGLVFSPHAISPAPAPRYAV